MRNALCSRGGRLLELLRTANMNAQRKTSPSESCTQCLTKRAPGEDSHDPTGRRCAARASAARCMVPRHELLQMHGTYRYPAGPRSVLRQRFASALLLAVVAGAHAALVAALLLHRQAFRLHHRLPSPRLQWRRSRHLSRPWPSPSRPSRSPGPIARCVHQSRRLPRRPPRRLRLLRRRLRHWQGLRRQPPRRPRCRVFRRTTSVTPPRPTPGCRGSSARRDR